LPYKLPSLRGALAGYGKTAEINKIRNSHYAEFDIARPQRAY